MANINAYGPEALTAAFISLRDKRKELKAQFDIEDYKYVQQMEKLEVAMMQKLKDAKVDSFKTQYGTVYTVDTIRYKCADFTGLWQAVVDQGRPDFLEKRVSKSAMDELLNEGKELPPGVEYTKVREVRVRRN